MQISFEGVKSLEGEGWNFTLDDTKMSLSGTYKTQTSADALGEGYLVLKDGETVKAYSLTQNADGWGGSNQRICYRMGI